MKPATPLEPGSVSPPAEEIDHVSASSELDVVDQAALSENPPSANHVGGNESGQSIGSSSGESNGELKRQVVSTGMWTLLGMGFTMVARFGGNLILARLLFPEAFGLMLLVDVFVLGLTMFSDVGIGPSIIQSKRGLERSFLRTAWTVQIARGLALYTVALLLTYPVAVWVFHEPMMLMLLPVAAFSAVFDGLASTKVFTSQRKMQIGRLTLVETSSYALGLVVMLVGAYFYRTVWVLVIGTLVSRAARTLFGHLFLQGARDGIGFDRPSARELFSFGKWIFLSTGVTFLAMQGDKLMLGGLGLPLMLLGNFGIAVALSEALYQLARQLSQKVLFPLYSRVHQESPEKLGGIYYRSRVRLDAAAMIGIGCLIMLGSDIVGLLYDERYQAAGILLQILGFRVALGCTLPAATVCLLAIGQSRTMFMANLAKAAALLILMPVGYVVGGMLYESGWLDMSFYKPFAGDLSAMMAAKSELVSHKYHEALARLIGVVGAVVVAEMAQAPFLYVELARRGILRIRRELLTFAFLAIGLSLGWGLHLIWGATLS